VDDGTSSETLTNEESVAIRNKLEMLIQTYKSNSQKQTQRSFSDKEQKLLRHTIAEYQRRVSFTGLMN